MIQFGGEGDLAEEAFGAESVGEFGLKDLEGDGAVVLQVMGQIDRGHAAAAQLPPDRVTAGQGRMQAPGKVGHFRSPQAEAARAASVAMGRRTADQKHLGSSPGQSIERPIAFRGLGIPGLLLRVSVFESTRG